MQFYHGVVYGGIASGQCLVEEGRPPNTEVENISNGNFILNFFNTPCSPKFHPMGNEGIFNHSFHPYPIK